MSALEDITGGGKTVAPSGAPSSLESLTGGSARPVAEKADLKAPVLPAGNATPDFTKIQPANTSGLFSKFMSTVPSFTSNMRTSTPSTTKDQFSDLTDNPIVKTVTGGKKLAPFIQDVASGLPDASGKVSKAINDTVIGKPADLLSNTKFIKESAEGIDLGSTSGLFAQEMLHKLSYGLEGLSGVTGGLYQAPENPEQDMTDKVLKTLSQGIGMAVGMSSIGSAAARLPAIGGVVSGLTGLANKYPLTAKYLAPYIKPLVENAAGFAAYGQLDPSLAGNMQARAKKLALDIGTSPLYTALGAIRNPAFSLPASFGLGFGMAKLSGASNEDAVASGLAFGFLDAVGRVGGHRGLTPDDIQEKLDAEALKTLNRYSDDVRITKDSTKEQYTAAYNRAVHQVHPAVGGDDAALTRVKSAYDVLTRGAVSRGTKDARAPEESVETLKSEIQTSLQEHGGEVTHQALMENLGVDAGTASRLVTSAQKPSVEDFGKVSEKILGDLGYIPNDQLPVIDAGPTPKEKIPTIQIGEKKPTRIGKYTYKPVKTERSKRMLSDLEALALKQETATEEASRMVERGLPELVDSYIKENGNLVNTDNARELFPSYEKDRSKSAEVHEAASTVAKAAYDRLLLNSKGKGNNTVLFTAGGTGAGKSSAIERAGEKLSEYPIIYDTNLNDTASASRKIDQALANGYDVNIMYVHNDIHTSLDNALSRAEKQALKSGTGRTVPIKQHIDTHVGGTRTLPELAERYPGNDGVKIRVIDNEGNGARGRVENPVDFIKSKGYNEAHGKELEEKLRNQIEASHAEGKISDRTKEGFLGKDAGQPRGRDSGRDERRPQGDGEVTPEITPVEGTGDTKVRGLSLGVEEKAVEANLVSNLGDLPEYKTVNMKEQAARATDLIATNYEQAKRIAMGQEIPPEGLLPESVFVAVEQKAIADGDVNTLRDLATASTLVEEATTMGQRIRTLAERDPDSPVAAISKIAKIREKAAKRKYGDVKKARAETVSAIKKEIKKAVPSKESWADFVSSIQC